MYQGFGQGGVYGRRDGPAVGEDGGREGSARMGGVDKGEEDSGCFPDRTKDLL